MVNIISFKVRTQSTADLIRDGAGLVTGVLQTILRRNSERPKVLVATHFHEIFEAGYLVNEANILFGHLEIRVNLEAGDLENQIAYLYK